MADDTIFEVDERQYVNPQTNLNERLQFIDTLRDVTAANTAQIKQDTYNLGSPVTSNVGGLGGAEGLWKAQYQTPQLEAKVADLRQTAQANAMTQAMQNLSDYETNRLKQAWRGYYARKKAQEDADRAGGNNGNNGNGDGLNITTETPVGSGDLTVETAPVTVSEAELNKNALKNAVYEATSSGDFHRRNSQGLTYTANGVPYYVVLWRNPLGVVTGGSVYTASGGNLTHTGDYSAKGITGLLNGIGRSGGQLFDLNGSDVTTNWSLI